MLPARRRRRSRLAYSAALALRRRPAAATNQRLHRRRPDRLQLAVLQQLRRGRRSGHPGRRRLQQLHAALASRAGAPSLGVAARSYVAVMTSTKRLDYHRHRARSPRLALHPDPACLRHRRSRLWRRVQHEHPSSSDALSARLRSLAARLWRLAPSPTRASAGRLAAASSGCSCRTGAPRSNISITTSALSATRGFLHFRTVDYRSAGVHGRSLSAVQDSLQRQHRPRRRELSLQLGRCPDCCEILIEPERSI